MRVLNGPRARVKAREYTQMMWTLRKRFVGGVLCALITGWGGVALSAQPIERVSGRTRLGLVSRQLNNTGSFMMVTAHPDDENNGVLALLSQGEGVRTTLVTATRGDGGQNEIGPELFDALAALRTEELLAAHRLDGAEQYFTRAVDFGYSFSREETFEQWGREAILGDFVRMIRTIKRRQSWPVRLTWPLPTRTGFPDSWPRGFARGRRASSISALVFPSRVVRLGCGEGLRQTLAA